MQTKNMREHDFCRLLGITELGQSDKMCHFRKTVDGGKNHSVIFAVQRQHPGRCETMFAWAQREEVATWTDAGRRTCFGHKRVRLQ